MRTWIQAAVVAVFCLFASMSGAMARDEGDGKARHHHVARHHARHVMHAKAHRHSRRHVASKAARHHRHIARTDADEDAQPVRSHRGHSGRRMASHRSRDEDGGSGGTTGMASYYWEPQALASGGRFNPNALTAAHKTLPFGTRVRVTNVGNGRSVNVTINDRGPYVGGRIIDLSKAAASAISMTGQGVARVRMVVLGR